MVNDIIIVIIAVRETIFCASNAQVPEHAGWPLFIWRQTRYAVVVDHWIITIIMMIIVIIITTLWL